MGQEAEECSSEGNPAMKRLEDAILEGAISGQSNPSSSSMELIASIKVCLNNEIFNHQFQSPLDHPPYAEMIYKAIEEVNKNGGYSNASALSTYIKSDSEYKEELPWAHESLLSHHLRRLNMKGEIIVAGDGCYTFPKLKCSHSNHQQNGADLLLLHDNGDEGTTLVAEDEDLLAKFISERKGKTRKEKEEGKNHVNVKKKKVRKERELREENMGLKKRRGRPRKLGGSRGL